MRGLKENKAGRRETRGKKTTDADEEFSCKTQRQKEEKERKRTYTLLVKSDLCADLPLLPKPWSATSQVFNSL